MVIFHSSVSLPEGIYSCITNSQKWMGKSICWVSLAQISGRTAAELVQQEKQILEVRKDWNRQELVLPPFDGSAPSACPMKSSSIFQWCLWTTGTTYWTDLDDCVMLGKNPTTYAIFLHCQASGCAAVPGSRSSRGFGMPARMILLTSKNSTSGAESALWTSRNCDFVGNAFSIINRQLRF